MEKMRQWSILTAVAVVALLALGWFLLVSPQRSHAADLRTQAQSQQSANSTLQTQVSQLEQQKEGLPAQQRLLNQIASKIPNNPELPALIRQLSVAAKGAGVDLVSLAPGQPSLVVAQAATQTLSGGSTAAARHSAAHAKVSPLAQIPITITVTGSYYNVESFFAAVEKLNRAMLVTAWTLAPADASGSSSSAGSPAGAGQTLPPGALNGVLTATVFESPDVLPTQVSPGAPVAPAK